MRIVHVIEGLVQTGGTSVFCAEAALQQVLQGHDVTLFYHTANYYPVDQRVSTAKGDSLSELGFTPDLVHIHAVLAPFPVKCMRWCRKHKVPYVVSPHGGLMPRVFSKSRIKKTLFFFLFLRASLNHAAALHCTGDAEREAVRLLGIKSKIFVVPLGVYLPTWPIVKSVPRQRNLLFLSRLGEEKGLELLLLAWKNIDHRDWHLILAGPDWLGHRRKLENLIAKERIRDVSFPGLVCGAAKDRLYRDADVFVLPSPMENFSMVVLDALAYGVPVVCTQGTPWQSIEEENCGWWIESNSVRALELAIKDAMGKDEDECAIMSTNARHLAERYSWKMVCEALTREHVRVANDAESTDS